MLVDNQMDRYSVMTNIQNTDRQTTDFDLCSDRFVRELPGYEFDKNCHVVPSSKTPTTNFNSLKEYLLSNDPAVVKDFKKDVRFLDGKVSLDGERVACLSFMRSGSTFLRQLLEKVTGIYTGQNDSSSASLYEAMMGRAGQGHVSDNDKVWITSSHFPFKTAETRQTIEAQRVICVVRNPLDVIASYAYTSSTMSHSLMPQESLPEAFPEWWKVWVREMADKI